MGCFRKCRVAPAQGTCSDSSLQSSIDSRMTASSTTSSGKDRRWKRSNKVSPQGSTASSLIAATSSDGSLQSNHERPFDHIDLNKLTDIPIRPCECKQMKPEPVTLGKKAKKLFDQVLRAVSLGKLNADDLKIPGCLKKRAKGKAIKKGSQCDCKNPYPERIAKASFHQGSICDLPLDYELQCPGISCASQALTAAYCHQTKPTSSWDEEILNLIILQGDNLHWKTLLRRAKYGLVDDMLALDEIACSGVLFGQYFELDRSTEPIGGNLFKLVEPFPTIEDLVAEMMKRKERASYLLRFLNYTIAILVDEDGGLHVFDSHERDGYGAAKEDGRASVFKFKKASNLAAYLIAFCMDILGIKNPKELSMEDQSFEVREIRFVPPMIDREESELSLDPVESDGASQYGTDGSLDDDIIFGSELYYLSSENEAC